jgi:hypothetical protein
MSSLKLQCRVLPPGSSRLTLSKHNSWPVIKVPWHARRSPGCPQDETLLQEHIVHQSVNYRFVEVIIAIYRQGMSVSSSFSLSRAWLSCLAVWVNDYHLILFSAPPIPSSPTPPLASSSTSPSSLLRSSGAFRYANLYYVVSSQSISSASKLQATPVTSGRPSATSSRSRPSQRVSNRGHIWERYRRAQRAVRSFPWASKSKRCGRRSEFDFFWAGPVLAPMTWTLTEYNRREPDVLYWVQLFRPRYPGMNIIVGRDKLFSCVSCLRVVIRHQA